LDSPQRKASAASETWIRLTWYRISTLLLHGIIAQRSLKPCPYDALGWTVAVGQSPGATEREDLRLEDLAHAAPYAYAAVLQSCAVWKTP
jgi:hypothetical protein